MSEIKQALFECQHCKEVFYARYWKPTKCKCGKSSVKQEKGGVPKASIAAKYSGVRK